MDMLKLLNDVDEQLNKNALIENERKVLVKEICKYDPDEVIICRNVNPDGQLVHYDIIGEFDGESEGLDRTESTKVINQVEKIIKEIGYEVYHEVCEYDG